MKEKLILIVEDEAPQRQALELALKLRGFQAESAGTVAESRALIERLGDEADVVVLDMLLEDRKASKVTGADLGIEFLNERRKRERWEDVRSTTLPEFLILSAYAEADYYRKAIDLDVAAYLHKQLKNQDEVIRHIRALALRRALNLGQSRIVEQTGLIAERSRTPFEAVTRLCQRVLAPEFETTLGAPFIMLLGSRGRAEKCGGHMDLPNGVHWVYSRIQALTHGKANRSEPFVLDMQLLSEPPDKDAYWLYERMDGGAFLPFWLGNDLRLTIGILRDTPENKLAEPPELLCMVLDQYLRPSILEHTVDVLTKLTQLKVQRETILAMTSKSCISTSQEQLALLEDGVMKHEVDPTTEFFKKMKNLAEDLRATGETLLPLDGENGETASQEELEEQTQSFRISELIDDAWRTVLEQIESDGVEAPIITSEHQFQALRVEATRVELLLAVIRILQWMVQRKHRVPTGTKQEIFVSWSEHGENTLICLEDRSARLSHRWRQFLFEPFAQAAAHGDWKYVAYESESRGESTEGRMLTAGRYLPLYLAKMLVELKNGGQLTDETEAMPEERGHRFVMTFPRQIAQLASFAA